MFLGRGLQLSHTKGQPPEFSPFSIMLANRRNYSEHLRYQKTSRAPSLYKLGELPALTQTSSWWERRLSAPPQEPHLRIWALLIVLA